MKTWFAVFFAACSSLFVACDGKKESTSNGLLEEPSDSDSVVVDSIAMTEEEMSDMPVTADELFDDFFFNYASNKHLQSERTVYPLPIERDGKTKMISQKAWRNEQFFMPQDYYTLFFDSPQQMDLVKDTAVANVTVERINLEKDEVKQYLFSRLSGQWRLEKICYQPLADNPNAQFLSFYKQFVGDSIFQRRSLSSQIRFVGPDPEDDFNQIEGVITPDFWDAFAPEFPKNLLFNIVYGHQNAAATQKIMVIRGIANGLEMEITFHLYQGRWKLTRLIT